MSIPLPVHRPPDRRASVCEYFCPTHFRAALLILARTRATCIKRKFIRRCEPISRPWGGPWLASLDRGRPPATAKGSSSRRASIAWKEGFFSDLPPPYWFPRRRTGVGKVEVWRGDVRLSMSVSAPFVWRCLSGSAVAPFPHPAHRTGRADFPHPALGQDLTPSFACDAIGSF